MDWVQIAAFAMGGYGLFTLGSIANTLELVATRVDIGNQYAERIVQMLGDLEINTRDTERANREPDRDPDCQ